jgi:hypothetical protein
MRTIDFKDEVRVTVTDDMKWTDIENDVDFHLENLRSRILEEIADKLVE